MKWSCARPGVAVLARAYQRDAGIVALGVSRIDALRSLDGQIDHGDAEVLAVQPDRVRRLAERDVDDDLALEALLGRVDGKFPLVLRRHDRPAKATGGRRHVGNG